MKNKLKKVAHACMTGRSEALQILSPFGLAWITGGVRVLGE